MSKIHLVIPDSHAHPDYNNDRAIWIGCLINDLKPDVVINIGDMFDMASMATYDKGKASTFGRSYRKDIDAGLDFDDKLWYRIRKNKRKKPFSVFLEGNHEQRLKRILEFHPELQGMLSFKDYDLDRNYNEVIEYEGDTPGVFDIDGIHYAHYFISGVMGRPVGGERPASQLLAKHFGSCTCGHIHTFDYAIRSNTNGKKFHGLVAGVAQDYTPKWAGVRGPLWTRGVAIKRAVEDGNYELQWVSLDTLRKEYGG